MLFLQPLLFSTFIQIPTNIKKIFLLHRRPRHSLFYLSEGRNYAVRGIWATTGLRKPWLTTRWWQTCCYSSSIRHCPRFQKSNLSISSGRYASGVRNSDRLTTKTAITRSGRRGLVQPRHSPGAAPPAPAAAHPTAARSRAGQPKRRTVRYLRFVALNFSSLLHSSLTGGATKNG